MSITRARPAPPVRGQTVPIAPREFVVAKYPDPDSRLPSLPCRTDTPKSGARLLTIAPDRRVGVRLTGVARARTPSSSGIGVQYFPGRRCASRCRKVRSGPIERRSAHSGHVEHADGHKEEDGQQVRRERTHVFCEAAARVIADGLVGSLASATERPRWFQKDHADGEGTGESTRRADIGLVAALSIGVGGMIGAGIFSILGVVARVAGSAMPLSFAIGGVVAGLAAYSYAALGKTFPSVGGAVTFVVRGYGEGVASGSLNLFQYFSYPEWQLVSCLASRRSTFSGADSWVEQSPSS